MAGVSSVKYLPVFAFVCGGALGVGFVSLGSGVLGAVFIAVTLGWSAWTLLYHHL